MAVAKMETAADRYRRIKEERLRNEQLFDVKTPSGMVWKLRRLQLAQFLENGVMPIDLASKLAAAAESGGDNQEMLKVLSVEERLRTIAFKGTVVRYCAIDPCIVETATKPNEIGFEEVEMDDANAIFEWAIQGGDEVVGLKKFPRKRK